MVLDNRCMAQLVHKQEESAVNSQGIQDQHHVHNSVGGIIAKENILINSGSSVGTGLSFYF